MVPTELRFGGHNGQSCPNMEITMDNALLKTAIIAVLESMSNDELIAMTTDSNVVIMKYDDYIINLRGYLSSEMSVLSTADHLTTKEGAFTEVYPEVLDALWGLHDDPSEKNKAILSWLAKQQ